MLKGGVDMERYLTEKVRPGRDVKVLESVALIVLICLLAACIWFEWQMVSESFPKYGFSWAVVVPPVLMILVAALMCPVAERIRARHHAQLIVTALLASQGRIPVDEVDDRTGMRRGADYAMQLVSRGYLTDVRLVQGFLCVADVADDIAPAEEVTPLFRDAEE